VLPYWGHWLFAGRPKATNACGFVFVADGGHHENLGIEALLDRRCSVIIASDAGADKDFLFEDFAKLYRRCRQKGIRFLRLGGPDPNQPLDLGDLLPVGPPRTAQLPREHRVFGRIVYPDDRQALFVYVKSSVRASETFDLWQYRAVHPQFPHDSTFNQFFDAEQFESYRELGYQIGVALCRELRPREWGAAPIDARKLMDRLGQTGTDAGNGPVVRIDPPAGVGSSHLH
jgi:hypothetical protein